MPPERCEACNPLAKTQAVRRIYSGTFPSGYAVCARHGRDRRGRPIPSDWRYWDGLDEAPWALARLSLAAGETPEEAAQSLAGLMTENARGPPPTAAG